MSRQTECCYTECHHGCDADVGTRSPNFWYESFSNFNLAKLTVIKEKRFCPFFHFFASANTNSSAHGPDWPIQHSVSHSSSNKTPSGTTVAVVVVASKENFFFMSFLFGLYMKGFSLKLRRVQLCHSLAELRLPILSRDSRPPMWTQRTTQLGVTQRVASCWLRTILRRCSIGVIWCQ